MTIISAGYAGGPMSEAQYASLVGTGVATFDSTADFAPTGVSGTRSVSLAPGSSNYGGVRVSSDSAIVQPLTAPGSGGAWFLLALRRTWSPTKLSTIQVFGGPTTGTTTVPTAAPTTLPTGFAKVTTVQADQPIAWAFVNSADTTVTIFDLRLVRDGMGRPSTVSKVALDFSALWLSPGEGSILFDRGSRITYRWSGTRWAGWDSDWMTAGIGTLGLNANTYGTSPGWVSSGSTYRYVSGLIRFRGQISLQTGTTISSQLGILLPVKAETPTGAAAIGKATAADASANYANTVVDTGIGATALYFATGPNSPFTWTTSDLMTWDVMYAPDPLSA
jgi:hypothetical protein